MKSNYIFLILLTLLLTNTISFAEDSKEFEPSIKFGVIAGLSTPNDMINDIYNKDVINWDNGIGSLAREGTKLGYHLGFRARLSLSKDYDFTGGMTINRFPQTTIQVKDPSDPDSIIQELQTNQNIFALAAGLNLYIYKSAISIYATGEMQYNYIANSVDFSFNDIFIPISQSPSDSRVGFGFGAGIDLVIKPIRLNIESKYNIINLIGQDDQEDMKSFLSLSLGLYFN